MAPPNDAHAFCAEIHLIGSHCHALRLSDMLADLLSAARDQYAWNAETAKESQDIIIRLEDETARRLASLDGESAQWIVQKVSRWGGNNETAIRKVASGSSEQNRKLAELINQLLTPASVKNALRDLTKQPGLGLVMASKIYRFAVRRPGQP